MTRQPRGDWRRVTRAELCPVCGRPDWCLVAGPEDGPTAAICARTESPKRCGDAGWLHRLIDEGRDDWRRRRRVIIPTRPTPDAGGIDFEALADKYFGALGPEERERFALSLGLSPESLLRLRVGWSERYGSYSFPMRDAGGRAVGIRLRRPDGKKFAVTGGREGLFLPEYLPAGGRLCITEGPTDCAALLDAGLPAIGRPSCSGGIQLAVTVLARIRSEEVAIIADSDAPGLRGAESLAAILVAFARVVRIVTPPSGIKDVRAWRNAGATTADIEAAIEAAPARRLEVIIERTGKAGR